MDKEVITKVGDKINACVNRQSFTSKDMDEIASIIDGAKLQPMPNIEEVKKILDTMNRKSPECSDGDYWPLFDDKELLGIARQICQLFQIPLGENEELAVVEKKSELPDHRDKMDGGKYDFPHWGEHWYIKSQLDMLNDKWQRVVRKIGGL